jgi:hypothetical protein
MNVTDRSLIRAIRGPVTLITVGVLFALNNFTPYGFGQTWPVLLIVFGMLSLLCRGGDRPAPPMGGPGFPPYGYPPPPGGYHPNPYPSAAPPPPPREYGPGAPPRSGDSL